MRTCRIASRWVMSGTEVQINKQNSQEIFEGRPWVGEARQVAQLEMTENIRRRGMTWNSKLKSKSRLNE
jgi:hypothetical protein